MNLGYPLGLLGLVAIPVLIFIYIIKNRFTEQTISSTYIWNLSEKFLRRRVPISKIAGLLSLILQILIVAFVSFAMAEPVITIAGSASSYCFVLDGSGSMQYVQEGKTRFELAKKEVIKIIDSSMKGSDYTLIYVGSSTATLYEKATDKDVAKQALVEMSGDFVVGDKAAALNIAQRYFDENPSTLVYLLTDAEYVMCENVALINVADAVTNYALTGVKYGLSGAQLKISGTVISYSDMEELEVELYFNGEKERTAAVNVITDEFGAPFEFFCDTTSFESILVRIKETDSFPLDNEVVLYDVNYENISDVMLVSDNPFFIQSALTAAGIGHVEVFGTTEPYRCQGYGLYVFDGCTPETMPDDGAVWFFNPQASVQGSNFSYQTEVDNPKTDATYSDSSAKLVETLLEGVTRNEFKIKKYIKCGMSAKFTSLITCEGNPLLFVGNNAFGNREVVFAFDVHDSAQFTLLGDFVTLIKNFINYSFPTVIEETFYYSGEEMLVNVIAGCNTLRLVSPNGKTTYLDSTSDACVYTLNEVGVYKLILGMKDGSERTLNLFSAMPEEEREPYPVEMDFTILGVQENEKYDGFFEVLMYLFIALAVLMVVDYGVYCYEQYQLR